MSTTFNQITNPYYSNSQNYIGFPGYLKEDGLSTLIYCGHIHAVRPDNYNTVGVEFSITLKANHKSFICIIPERKLELYSIGSSIVLDYDDYVQIYNPSENERYYSFFLPKGQNSRIILFDKTPDRFKISGINIENNLHINQNRKFEYEIIISDVYDK